MIIPLFYEFSGFSVGYADVGQMAFAPYVSSRITLQNQQQAAAYLVILPAFLIVPCSVVFRVKCSQAIGTKAVGKMGICVIGDVDFNLMPISLVIPYFFAISAQG
jgi:ABC-type sulfate transport system permease subunit